MKQRAEIYRDNSLTKLLEVPIQLRSIKEILMKYRDAKELWEIDTKTTYKWITNLTIKKNKNKVEQKQIKY